MSVKIGSKYVCPACMSEFIVIKLGKADLKCCGKPMEEKGSKPN